MATLCPVCGEKDVIQKVTAVVSAGQTSGSFSGPTGGLTYSGGKFGVVGGYTRLSGNTQSDLARMLAAPARPRAYDKSEIGAFRLLFALLALLFAPGAAGSVLLGIWGFFFEPELGMSLVCLLFGIPVLYLLYKGVKKIQKMEDAEKGPKFQARIKAWEELLTIRERLYYCFRDDVVFDPKTRRTCSPREIGKFLPFLASHGL